MPTALQRRHARLEHQRLSLLDRLAAYSDAQRAFRPDPSSWSLADVVQHLVLVEEGLVRNGRAQAAARPPWVRVRTLLRERVMLAALRRDLRFQAPVAVVVPQEPMPLDALVPRWEAARADLAGYLEDLPAPTWARTAFRHPRIGWVTGMGGLRFIEAHCAHHGHQIARILAAEGFPG